MHARRLTPTVIELIPPATIDATGVALMARDAHACGRARDWLLDGTKAQFDRDSLNVIPRALDYAKQHDGLRRMVLVIPQAVGRLMAKGMLIHAPVAVVVVETRAEALGILGIR